FAKAPLLDPYDVYQHLMTYWADVMQDDVYAISHDGWAEAVRPRLLVEEKGKKSTEKPDLTVGKKKYKAELAPPALLVARYFEREQAEIDMWEAEAAKAVQKLDELEEEHGGDEVTVKQFLFPVSAVSRKLHGSWTTHASNGSPNSKPRTLSCG